MDGKPTRGDVALDAPSAHIDDRDGIQARTRDVQPRLVRRQRHPERQDAAQVLEAGHVELDLPFDLAAGAVDNRNGVVRGVRHVHEPRTGDDRTRARAADRGEVITIDTNEVPGLDAGGDAAVREIHLEHRHGIGIVRAAEPGHESRADRGSLFRFPRRHAVGGKRQAHRGARPGRDARHERIFEHADVRDPGGPLVRRERDRKRVTSNANGPDDALGPHVHNRKAVVELIDREERAPVAAEREVADETVHETAAVQLNRAGGPPRRHVQDDDPPFVGAAVVEARAVRREGAAHIGAIAELGMLLHVERRSGRHGERGPQFNKFQRVPAKERRERPIPADGEPPRVRSGPDDATRGSHAPPVHQCRRVPLDARGLVAGRRLDEPDPRPRKRGRHDAANGGHNQDRQRTEQRTEA